MKLCFLGSSHAARTLAEAARRRGFALTDDIAVADVCFISEDTPTDDNGVRDLRPVTFLVELAKRRLECGAIVVTSQVPPGFMREIAKDEDDIFHQAETLRIEDAMQRAMYPEMLIVGGPSECFGMTEEYVEYLEAFDCPILEMTYEEAEFAKIAINVTLISQIENTNRLAKAAEKVGADWRQIARVLRHDSRIGKYAYLTPGDPLASKHLLRDHVTLQGLCTQKPT